MRSRQENHDVLAEMLLMVCVFIWAGNYSLAKYGIAALNVFVFNGIRYVVAALVLAAVMSVRVRWTRVERADWPKLLGAGLVAHVIYQVAFIIGLSMTTAGNSAILLATSPLWTVFLNSKIHNERVLPALWIGTTISLAGVAMIVFGGGTNVVLGQTALLGDLICLAAAFLWAFSTVQQKPLLVRYSPQQVSLIMITVGAVGLALLAVPAAFAMSWGTVHWTYYMAAGVSGAASNGFANLFWSTGVQRLGPARTGNFGNLIPAIALGLSYVTLKEELSVLQVVGAGVTLLGIWYARR